jgi:hypothetical protein
MSVVYTADVFCDSEGCSHWTHSGTAALPLSKKLARRLMSDGFVHIKGKDYCRHCAAKLKATPAPSADAG